MEPLEYVNMFTGEAVLPVAGFWKYQIPRAESEEEAGVVFPKRVKYLGLPMDLQDSGIGQVFSIPKVTRLELPCDLEIGSKYSSSEKDKYATRRFDRVYVPEDFGPFERTDYPERLAAGQTNFNILESHKDLVVRSPVFYMGIGGKAVKYPETLYHSNYLGMGADYLDEPAARTTSYEVGPELRDNPEKGRDITPEYMYERFKEVFRGDIYDRRPTWLINGLKERDDVDIGDMSLLQANIFTWEVPIASAAYQLKAEPDGPPSAVVYESRICTSRDLPFIDSVAGIQIPTNDQKALLDMTVAMLRGAARTTGKKWGFSVYAEQAVGEIHSALKYAYDCGSSHFLFWTGHIPYVEQLAYSRFIRDYAEAHPDRDMASLRRAAEVIILTPPGYNGYNYIIEDRLWRMPALNLERRNEFGLKYRDVMHRIGMEIERCYRLGICYDLTWDIPGLDLSGYREVVRVKTDDTVEVTKQDGTIEVFSQSRPVERPQGEAPQLAIALSPANGSAPLLVTATAEVKEGSAPVRFTPWHDDEGVWRNQKVIWELYGPEDWDYRTFHYRGNPKHTPTYPSISFRLEKPGTYRLRASVVDLAGRSTVVWKEIEVNE